MLAKSVVSNRLGGCCQDDEKIEEAAEAVVKVVKHLRYEEICFALNRARAVFRAFPEEEPQWGDE